MIKWCLVYFKNNKLGWGKRKWYIISFDMMQIITVNTLASFYFILVDLHNKCYRCPLIEAIWGGKKGKIDIKN